MGTNFSGLKRDSSIWLVIPWEKKVRIEEKKERKEQKRGKRGRGYLHYMTFGIILVGTKPSSC